MILKDLIIVMSFGFYPFPSEKISKAGGTIQSESAGECHTEAGAVLGSPGPACHLIDLRGHSPPPQTELMEAGYNCLLALSGPFWLQDRGGCFI